MVKQHSHIRTDKDSTFFTIIHAYKGGIEKSTTIIKPITLFV